MVGQHLCAYVLVLIERAVERSGGSTLQRSRRSPCSNDCGDWPRERGVKQCPEEAMMDSQHFLGERLLLMGIVRRPHSHYEWPCNCEGLRLLVRILCPPVPSRAPQEVAPGCSHLPLFFSIKSVVEDLDDKSLTNRSASSAPSPHVDSSLDSPHAGKVCA